jgi:hypothetical protein
MMHWLSKKGEEASTTRFALHTMSLYVCLEFEHMSKPHEPEQSVSSLFRQFRILYRPGNCCLQSSIRNTYAWSSVDFQRHCLSCLITTVLGGFLRW